MLELRNQFSGFVGVTFCVAHFWPQCGRALRRGAWFSRRWLISGLVLMVVGFSLFMKADSVNSASLLLPQSTTENGSFRRGGDCRAPARRFPQVSIPSQTVYRDFLNSVLPHHYVKPGETLYSISRYYFVALDVLAKINGIARPECLEVGRTLLIPPIDFPSDTLRWHCIRPGETLADLAIHYNLDAGQVQRLNPFSNLKGVRAGCSIILPSRPYFGKVRPANDTARLRALICPIHGLVTSRFGMRWGRMHFGLDLAAPRGTPVRATAPGRVEFTGWQAGYGKLIKINHGDYHTYYAHLSDIAVRPGVKVAAGQLIGWVGATGHAYGNHLHFELERQGKKINPYSYLF